ncbi:hypothetical protein MD484_g8175, partial [Candolleomyces efflorescens]
MSSAFEKAHDFTLKASEINFGITNYYGHVGGSKAAALDKLREHIAAGAMHNSDERCSAPKCHPETRVAVQEEAMAWILDGDGERALENMLWVTGPAGGGKTAIMGSIATTCHAKGLLACGFFFSSFAGSVNRRSKKCLIATMAYQIVQHEALRDVGESILSSVERNPAVFEQQLEVQLEQLVLRPLRESPRGPRGPLWPRVVVIDGLDECDTVAYSETIRSPHVDPRTKEDDQNEILHVLLKAANDPRFPFRIIIASRPEPTFQDFFTGAASQITRKIFLDDKYNPDADMLLFLEAKFADIRRQYPNLPRSWPSEDVKQTLVGNASGQFIYVATAMRFVGGTSGLPQELLDQVLKLRPTDASTNPFAPLDALYTHILSRCSNPRVTVRWIHIIFHLIPVHTESTSEPVSAWFSRVFLERSPGEATYVLRGLNSLISIPATEDHTSPYSLFHKSLMDFLIFRTSHEDLKVDNSDYDLFNLRYLEIWKNKGPTTSLSPSELARFFEHYFTMHVLQPSTLELGRHTALYDIACTALWLTASFAGCIVP